MSGSREPNLVVLAYIRCTSAKVVRQVTARALSCWLCLALAGCVRAAAAEPQPACDPDPRYDVGSQRTGRFFKDAVKGKSAHAIRKALGPPSCQSATLWRYWLPQGCSYEKTVVSLWFRKGRVVRVNAVDIITGQECQ